MTEEEIDCLEALAKAATPGPWRWSDWGVRFGSLERSGCMTTLESPGDKNPDPAPRVSDPNENSMRVICDYDSEVSAEDKMFIAAARTAIPALIAEIRRLREGR